MKDTKFPNLYRGGRNLYTLNLTPGTLLFEEGGKHRRFDPNRSKLAAAIAKKISQIGISEGDRVLYLGASHGYTPSFVSDMVGMDGFVYALDFAPRVVRDLVFVCKERKNMAPVMADANRPDTFAFRVGQVDIVYQDVAQRNQTEIFLKNVKRFLRPGGFGLYAVKTRSIDITKKPKRIYNEVRQQLEKEVTVVDYRTLDPFEKDHAMFVVKKNL